MTETKTAEKAKKPRRVRMRALRDLIEGEKTRATRRIAGEVFDFVGVELPESAVEVPADTPLGRPRLDPTDPNQRPRAPMHTTEGFLRSAERAL